MSSHELAQLLLSKPDLPVAVAESLGVYHCDVHKFRIADDRKHLRFDNKEPKEGELEIDVLWIIPVL